RKLMPMSLTLGAALVLFVSARAADDPGAAYKLLTTITIPGGLNGFDISWVDSKSARYYLADRGNATATPPVPPRIDVIDTRHDKFLFSITGFAGPNGVVAIHGSGDDDESDQENAGELWVGDANSTAKVVDLTHPFAVPLS